ncbi:GerMN domain-containing protein [Alkaliphilus transvaalensis]|uniref:GerMN domain-containing protein n=1 Tax=Alkaliphilus transvaalensis TaxID=114628 RepID=UPI0006885766|nr:GerMN domain-containing protein [Alkaliphilus transvaalensis]
MRKNIWLTLFLIFLFVILMTRCVGIQYLDDDIGKAPLEIAPNRERTVELVNIYFANAENEYLSREQRAVERTVESKEEALLRELINGPRNRTLSPTIPPQTRFFSVLTVNGTSYVNFSREFVTNFRGGEMAETTTIYSIVNTLTELENIKEVQILIEGERIDKYQSNLSLKEPYIRNERIINKPFPTPIEVLQSYLTNIADENYRWAFDEIYRPLEYNLDYSIFYQYIRSYKADVEAFTIDSYIITKTEDGGIISLDYHEKLKNGDVVEYKEKAFQYKNDLGEWKLVFEPF